MYILCFRSKELSLRIDTGRFLPTWGVVKRALHISLPMGLQQTIMCSAYVMTTIIIAPLGTFAIAANSFGIIIESLCYMPGYGIANAAAALAALRELEAHPELVTKLQENALYMRGLLNERNIKMRPSNGDCIPIIPIYTYEPIPTLTIAKELYERGVYVNSSLPPAAAPHECLLRTSLMATHTHALIDEAVGVIADVLRGYDL